MDREKFCFECLIPKKKGQVHCTMCQVCCEELDHHCIFFGKCIGGGMILKTFNGSIAMLIVNIVYIFIMMGAIVFVRLMMAIDH